jgi:hypothetical protein
MSDYKLCKNGHNYPKNQDECPYCPKISDKTVALGGDNNKTQIFSGGNISSSTSQPSQKDFGKTQIFTGEVAKDKPASTRKIVGWIVSFTMNPNGADFRLFEGRNILGSDPGCDIVVPNDSQVSSKHLTILYRMGELKFKDELSTNGTFINEEFKEEGVLKDNDSIRIGSTIFKLRTVE